MTLDITPAFVPPITVALLLLVGAQGNYGLQDYGNDNGSRGIGTNLTADHLKNLQHEHNHLFHTSTNYYKLPDAKVKPGPEQGMGFDPHGSFFTDTFDALRDRRHAPHFNPLLQNRLINRKGKSIYWTKYPKCNSHLQ